MEIAESRTCKEESSVQTGVHRMLRVIAIEEVNNLVVVDELESWDLDVLHLHCHRLLVNNGTHSVQPASVVVVFTEKLLDLVGIPPARPSKCRVARP